MLSGATRRTPEGGVVVPILQAGKRGSVRPLPGSIVRAQCPPHSLAGAVLQPCPEAASGWTLDCASLTPALPEGQLRLNPGLPATPEP